MTIFAILTAIGAAVSAFLFRRGGVYNPVLPSLDNLTEIRFETPEKEEVLDSTIQPIEGLKQANTASSELFWDTPKQAWHSVRVLCDNEGLSLAQKNEICATIYGESEFDNRAVCKNRDAKGEVTSIDVGLCQWNSYWHCGKGKTFPSTEYVVANPEMAVRKMIEFYKEGHINLWVAHKSGRYAQFLPKTSRMWKLMI